MDTQCWISDAVEFVCSRGAFNYPLHTHASVLTLNCVRSGQATLYTRSGTMQYSAGEGFGLVPHVVHSLRRSTDSEVVSVCCAVKYVYVEGMLHRSRVQSILVNLHSKNLLVATEVEILKSVLLSMPSKLVEFEYEDIATRQLLVALTAHPEVNMRLATLTRQCGRSLWHAIRCFRETTGLTPHQFLMQNRIRQAKRLLRENTSLTDVALSAGFCDQSHLNRCLLRAVGLTPARYRLGCHHMTCHTMAWRSTQGREKLGKKT